MNKIISLTNKHIALATPLILYSLISSAYMVVTASNGKLINILFAIFLFFLMTGAFVAGWFNMIKLVILNPEREDVNSIIKEFPAGVGEYFLPTLGSITIMFIVSSLLLVISYFIGMSLIGDLGITTESFAKAMQNSNELKAFLSSLSLEQLTKMNLWNMLILGTLTFSYYLIFLYLPTLFFKNKNPFKAFFHSLKDLFSRKILKTTGIFVLIFILNFIISLFSTIFGGNIIIHFLITLLNFYFITAVGIGVFYYYHENFVKPLIGQNMDIRI